MYLTKLKVYFRNWNLVRVLRLFLALLVGGQAWYQQDVLFGILAVILLAQVYFNMGCCGVGGNCSDNSCKS